MSSSIQDQANLITKTRGAMGLVGTLIATEHNTKLNYEEKWTRKDENTITVSQILSSKEKLSAKVIQEAQKAIDAIVGKEKRITK